MKDNSNKKLVLIGILILVCMFSFYEVVSYYQGKDYEPIVRNIIEKNNDSSNINIADNNEEINLGDDDACSKWTYSCPQGGNVNGDKCRITTIKNATGDHKCPDRNCSWSAGRCFCITKVYDATKTCAECIIKTSGKVVGHVSPGSSVGSITISYSGTCSSQTITPTCENCISIGSCTIPEGTFVTERSCTLTATASDAPCKTGKFTTSVGGGGSFSIMNKWTNSTGTRKEELPQSSGDADKDSRDIWGVYNSQTGLWEVRQTRNACGSSSKHSYCCVKKDASGNVTEYGGYKENQADLNACGEEFTADEGIGKDSCGTSQLHSYCCVQKDENGNVTAYNGYKENQSDLNACSEGWTADEGIGKDSCITNYCCLKKDDSGHVIDASYKENQSDDNACSEGWTVDKNRSREQCVPDPKYCYGDTGYLSTAKSVEWLYEADSVNRVLISGVTRKEDCHKLEQPATCTPQALAVTPQNVDANICEDNVHLILTDGIDCPGAAFYSIECKTNAVVRFDNGDDNGIITDVNEIMIGQGFKFGIKLTLPKKCTAVFNGDRWNLAYERAVNLKNQANKDLQVSGISDTDKREVESVLYEMENRIDDLKGMVNAYNGIDLADTSDEQASLNISYKVNGKAADVNSEFETKIINEGKGNIYNAVSVSLKAKDVTEPKSYTWSNTSDPKIIKLVPVKKYIDGLDGGNKVYIDYNTDPGTYPIQINVSNIAGKNQVNNNMCKLKVTREEILYRPIDVSNPFINNKWEPGANWINSELDFRNIIHANIWSK